MYFQVTPHEIDGLESQGVGGKILHVDPRFGGRVIADNRGAKRVESIPDLEEPAWEVAGELAAKVPDEACLDGNLRMKAEEQTHVVTVR